MERTVAMAEYYELMLTHRVQRGGGYDLNIEQPIVVKGFLSPLIQKSVCDEDGNWKDEILIDEMYRKLKEYWKQTRQDGEQHGTD